MRHALFICSRAQWRSPTAVDLYRGSPDLEPRCAGTRSSARPRVKLDDLEWADVIFCMESEHKRELRERFPEVRREIVVLDIPDDYSRGDPELERLIEAGVEGWKGSGS